MSGDKAAASAPKAPSAASVKAMASELYGLALDDGRAAHIAAELARFAAVARAAGAVPADTAPGALFRQLLLAAYTAGADGARRA